jgi:thiamine biosynthesis lipoprotein
MFWGTAERISDFQNGIATSWSGGLSNPLNCPIRMFRAFILRLLLCSWLPLLHSGADESFEFRRPCMGTVWTIRLHAAGEGPARRAVDAAFARIEELDGILSDYRKDSPLNRLSATAGSAAPVTVSGDLLTVLTLSQQAAAESGGVFDITIGPCVQLWRAAKKSRRLPLPAELAAARAATGSKHLVLGTKTGTAWLKVPGMRLDVGGIAKGYAQDEAMKVLRDKHGITSALIDAGGGILVSARPPGRTAWHVEVARTREDESPALVRVENAAVATSGDLYQSVEIEGRRYSHIIDKSTGLGMTKSTQATVVAPHAALADWLATTLCLMGPEKGIAWLKEKYPECQARITRAGIDGPVQKESTGFAGLLLPRKE